MSARAVVHALVALLTLAGAVVSRSAVAHDGAGAAFDGVAGPYRVLAYDGRPVAGSAAEYAVVLADAGSGAPVDDATITVSARIVAGGGAAGTRVEAVVAERVANVYRYTLPAMRSDGWDVTLEIAAPAAADKISFPIHAEPSSAPSPVPVEPPGPARLLLIAGLGMLAAAAVTIPLIRRRANKPQTSRA